MPQPFAQNTSSLKAFALEVLFHLNISIFPNAVICLNETVTTKNPQTWTSGNVAFAGFNFIVLFSETTCIQVPEGSQEKVLKHS